MDPTQERQLERRLTQTVLQELDIRMEEHLKNIEADAHIWAAPFIRNTGGEMMLFVLGHQPKNVREYSFFERKHSHDTTLKCIANQLGKDNLTLLRICDRVIVARNQSSHCGNWEELELRIAQCLRLFARFPSLTLELKDQYVILRNWELFEQAFNLRHIRPQQPREQPSDSSTSWGSATDPLSEQHSQGGSEAVESW